MRLYKITDAKDNKTLFATTDTKDFDKKVKALLIEHGNVEDINSLKNSEILKRVLDLTFNFSIDNV